MPRITLNTCPFDTRRSFRSISRQIRQRKIEKSADSIVNFLPLSSESKSKFRLPATIDKTKKINYFKKVGVLKEDRENKKPS